LQIRTTAPGRIASPPASQQKSGTVPVQDALPKSSHVPGSASLRSQKPVQLKKAMVCCPETSGPVSEEKPKPPIPEHLPQPVKPEVAAPQTENRKKQQHAQSAQRRQQQSARLAAAHARSAAREERRSKRKASAQRKTRKRIGRAGRGAARHARFGQFKNKMGEKRAIRNSTFGKAKANIPQEIRSQFSATRLRTSEESDEDTE
jgi:hypothetical protein